MPHPRRHRRITRLLVGGGVLALLLAVYLAVMAVGGAWKNPCSRYGPAPEGALISERSDVVTEHRSFWPIGSVCDWQRADGRGTIRSDNGSIPFSALTYALAATGVALLVAAARRPS
ncbi:hypothetical protein [Leifsonia sp. 1010]|uniref:hypothetical protein n=1 Tax=Leifsonia sp. 1010 TaxID=2817769 RepID=UPI00285DCCDF|nr:hypothetical protein [Leifsonia sp. 1010]MDR6613937.1 hypothetical protein [Leifsonia sp. 1010]